MDHSTYVMPIKAVKAMAETIKKKYVGSGNGKGWALVFV